LLPVCGTLPSPFVHSPVNTTYSCDKPNGIAVVSKIISFRSEMAHTPTGHMNKIIKALSSSGEVIVKKNPAKPIRKH
jgi:hypothetical protein